MNLIIALIFAGIVILVMRSAAAPAVHVDDAARHGIPSPNLWKHCPWLDIFCGLEGGYISHRDFLMATDASGYPDQIIGDGTVTIGAEKGGMLTLNPGTTDNNEQYFAEGDNQSSPWIISDTAAEKSDLWFETEIVLPVIDEEVGIFIGLGEQDACTANEIDDDTMALDVFDFVGFQAIHATTPTAIVFKAIHQKAGGSAVVVDATAATVSTAGDHLRLGLYYESRSGNIYFYVNGTRLDSYCNVATATFPDSEELTFCCGIKVGKASSPSATLKVDWRRIAQLRPRAWYVDN